MRKLLDALAAALFFGLTWLVALLPQRIQYALADLLALLLYSAARYRRTVVYTNLRNSFPEKSPRDIARIARAFYRHLADLIVESAFMTHASKKRILARCTFDNIDRLLPYYHQGRSVVVAAAHYCNWEMLTCAQPHMRHLMLSIYKPMSNKRIERIMTRSRERLGSRTVPMRRTIRAVAHYVKEQHPVLVGLIADQVPVGSNHYGTTFLHQSTLVYRGIEHIAKLFDLPVFYCKMTQPKRGHFLVHLELITDAPRQTPPDWITEQHLRALERSIQEAPPYWLWSHRRWKRQPLAPTNHA